MKTTKEKVEYCLYNYGVTPVLIVFHLVQEAQFFETCSIIRDVLNKAYDGRHVDLKPTEKNIHNRVDSLIEKHGYISSKIMLKTATDECIKKMFDNYNKLKIDELPID